MFNRVLIANVIMIVYVFLGFYADTIINRKKRTIFWMFLKLMEITQYILLFSVTGVRNSAWSFIKFAIILFVHRKEEKIIQSPLEAVLLSSPFLVIGFINQEGFLAFLNSIACFVNSCQQVSKKDITLQRISYSTNIVHMIYDISLKSYVGAISCLCTVVISIINIVRIKKNGESYYYSKKNNS